MMFAAMAAFVACSDDDNNPGKKDFEEHDTYFVYHGVTYPIQKMADGRVWMAKNMQYIPEGLTPSTDPAEDAHIWYPYNYDGKDCIASTDQELINERGYLYDMEAALGTPITAENCASFEGQQGICPKGWHIPTQKEYIDLVGKTNKNAEGVDLTNVNAPYYDKDLDNGLITLMDKAGWNVTRSGMRFCSTITSTGKYQSSIDKVNYLHTMTFFMSSTIYKPLYKTVEGAQVLNNIQYFAMMTNYASKYASAGGGLSLAYNAFKSGVSVRCIKDAN